MAMPKQRRRRRRGRLIEKKCFYQRKYLDLLCTPLAQKTFSSKICNDGVQIKMEIGVVVRVPSTTQNFVILR